jgi:hypothetical protein
MLVAGAVVVDIVIVRAVAGVPAAAVAPGAAEAVATESDERAFAGAHLGYRR